MLLNCFFLTESHNPDLPEEEWTLVYENTVPGAYSQNFGWGKYKIVMSGGGGSGAALIRESTAVNMEFVFCNNGSSAQQQTVFMNVLVNENKNFSGVIGGGGKGCRVDLIESPSTFSGAYTKGAIGTGYINGSVANQGYAYSSSKENFNINAGAWVGGSGGGSTSLEIEGILNSVASGGNGGSVRINYGGFKDSNGGIGGSGGSINGTGSSGGENTNITTRYGATAMSVAGADGYIRIYKSNLKPEPV